MGACGANMPHLASFEIPWWRPRAVGRSIPSRSGAIYTVIRRRNDPGTDRNYFFIQTRPTGCRATARNEGRQLALRCYKINDADD